MSKKKQIEKVVIDHGQFVIIKSKLATARVITECIGTVTAIAEIHVADQAAPIKVSDLHRGRNINCEPFEIVPISETQAFALSELYSVGKNKEAIEEASKLAKESNIEVILPEGGESMFMGDSSLYNIELDPEEHNKQIEAEEDLYASQCGPCKIVVPAKAKETVEDNPFSMSVPMAPAEVKVNQPAVSLKKENPVTNHRLIGFEPPTETGEAVLTEIDGNPAIKVMAYSLFGKQDKKVSACNFMLVKTGAEEPRIYTNNHLNFSFKFPGTFYLKANVFLSQDDYKKILATVERLYKENKVAHVESGEQAKELLADLMGARV